MLIFSSIAKVTKFIILFELFCAIKDKLVLNKNIIKTIEANDWNKKNTTNFSLFFSLNRLNINDMVFSSSIIHISTQFLHPINISAETSNIAVGINKKLFIIKEIPLSMGYEPTSFFSLLYFL